MTAVLLGFAASPRGGLCFRDQIVSRLGRGVAAAVGSGAVRAAPRCSSQTRPCLAAPSRLSGHSPRSPLLGSSPQTPGWQGPSPWLRTSAQTSRHQIGLLWPCLPCPVLSLPHGTGCHPTHGVCPLTAPRPAPGRELRGAATDVLSAAD